MICWPALSIPLCPPQLSLPHSVSNESIHWCYLPIFSFASLFFCHLVRCLAGWSLQGLRIWWCVHTTSVFALWQWRIGHHAGRWLGWSFAGLPRLWRVGCRRYPWVACSISSPCSVFSSVVLLLGSRFHKHTRIWKWRVSAVASPLMSDWCFCPSIMAWVLPEQQLSVQLWQGLLVIFGQYMAIPRCVWMM